MSRPITLVASVALLVTGCATAPTTIYKPTTAIPPPLEASVLVLPADVEMYQVSAGGNDELKADWSEAAREGLYEALEEFFFERGVRPIGYASDSLEDQDLAIIRQANINLDAIQLAQEGRAQPGMRQYALSPELTASLAEYDADYALFVMLRARKASAGRAVVRVLTRGPLSFEILVGSYRVALFDLRDGQVAWANLDPEAWRGLGNPADADAAAWLKSFRVLFRDFPL